MVPHELHRHNVRCVRHDLVDVPAGSHDGYPLLERGDRSTLVLRHNVVREDPDDEPIPESARLPQQLDVPGVEQVTDQVDVDTRAARHAAPLSPAPYAPCRRCGDEQSVRTGSPATGRRCLLAR